MMKLTKSPKSHAEKMITFRLSQQQYESIAALALAHEVSIAWLVRTIVESAVAQGVEIESADKSTS